MAQHDMNIANQGFPATRADINNALQAIATNNSGTSAPSTTFANQWFYNSNTNKLFIRNEANNAFIEVATLDQTNNEWQITTGQISAGDGDGLVFKTDDGTTRAVLDDSGHFVVGKSAADAGATAGIELRNDGNARFTKDGGSTATFNRLSSDGTIATFQKAGTTVGSIVTGGGDLAIGTGTTSGMRFNDTLSNVLPYNVGGVAYSDNAIDLGYSTVRWKDLYLSGGVYLGGTTSANELDDYEEGTWTPAVANGTLGGTSPGFSGTYTKIGRTVFFTMDVTNGAGDLNIASFVRFSGLPFTVLKTGTGVVVTEDIDVFDRQGFCTAGQGGTSITFGNCGSTSGTTALRASVVCTVS